VDNFFIKRSLASGPKIIDLVRERAFQIFFKGRIPKQREDLEEKNERHVKK